MTPLKIIFMGTPEFSIPTLRALDQSNHDMVAVYCQPPRPADRGGKVRKSPIQQEVEKRDLPVYTPPSFSKEEALEIFRSHKADIAIVVAYGLLLPKKILEIPPLGCINIHASLLPRWRGAAPIQRAIEAGDKESGITIMQMDEGLDTGHMLLKESVPIHGETTAETLHNTLSELGSKLILETLQGISQGSLEPTPQPDKGVTYAKKLSPSESLIDWTLSSQALDRKIRALTPWPGVYFRYQGTRIKILKAKWEKCNKISEHGNQIPGIVLDEALLVACGEGVLRLQRLQKEGKSPLESKAFLNGTPLPQGTRLI